MKATDKAIKVCLVPKLKLTDEKRDLNIQTCLMMTDLSVIYEPKIHIMSLLSKKQ